MKSKWSKKFKIKLKFEIQIKAWIEQDANPYEVLEEMFEEETDFSRNVSEFFLMVDILADEDDVNTYYYLAACYSQIIQHSNEMNQGVFWKDFSHFFQRYLNSEHVEYFLIMNIFCYDFGEHVMEEIIEHIQHEQALARIKDLYAHDVYS